MSSQKDSSDLSKLEYMHVVSKGANDLLVIIVQGIPFRKLIAPVP